MNLTLYIYIYIYIYIYTHTDFLRTVRTVLWLCSSMEWGHVCPTSTIPCPVDATKFWWHWPYHLTQISFCGQHLSGVWRSKNLKVRSWGYMVDVVTQSFQVTWWLPESWHWWKACVIVLKQHIMHVLDRPNMLETLSSFFSSCWYMRLS
jgi:hypothetical protein